MSHTAELIAVGTELLLGSIANTDAQTVSRALSGLGINVYYHTVVGDNPQRVRSAVELARTRADIIITTGGLGPTCDDLTKEAVASAFGKKLEFHEECAQSIRARFADTIRAKTMTENNLRQAWLPEGCTVLPNSCGTAPGCAFEADGIHVLMLPGPPGECRAMLEEQAVPYLQKLADGIIRSRTLKIFGMGESAVETLLHDRMLELTNPTLAPYAKTGEVELRLTAKADTAQAADNLLDPLEQEVRGVLGDLIYGVDVPSLEAAVLALLKERQRTLATAESCTGGLIAKRMTDLPGASSVFLGGVVSYVNQVKADVLGVPQTLLEQHGAVSDPVARAMCQGARRVMGSDLAVSVTGVAGPDPDDRGNPVGLVFIALTDGANTWVRKTDLGRERGRVRTLAAHHGLDMVRRYLTGLPVVP
jgi:nicotinamide-nucleotide amidase